MPLLELALIAQTLLANELAAKELAATLDPVEQLATWTRSASTRPPPEAFVYLDEPNYEPAEFTTGEPATKRSRKLFELAQTIEREGSDVTYSHRTTVRRKEGRYHFDCSGMLNWMLDRISDKALETLDRERPVAATYVRIIGKSPTTKHRNGWRQVDRIADVKPGDIFAWKRPPNWPKGGNTGHCGIVRALPQPVEFIENAYVVRVYDSTRYAHQDDPRYDSGDTGFGSGTILFMADDDGKPIGYGWFGSQSGGWYQTDVTFGRI